MQRSYGKLAYNLLLFESVKPSPPGRGSLLEVPLEGPDASTYPAPKKGRSLTESDSEEVLGRECGNLSRLLRKGFIEERVNPGGYLTDGCPKWHCRCEFKHNAKEGTEIYPKSF